MAGHSKNVATNSNFSTINMYYTVSFARGGQISSKGEKYWLKMEKILVKDGENPSPLFSRRANIFQAGHLP